MQKEKNYGWALDSARKNPYNSRVAHPGVAQLVARMVRDHEAVGSNPATRTMQSVLIGSEYPVMDTLLFYVENGETPEMSLLTRSRRHSSLTLCSVSRSMYCFVMPQSRPKRSRLFTLVGIPIKDECLILLRLCVIGHRKEQLIVT